MNSANVDMPSFGETAKKIGISVTIPTDRKSRGTRIGIFDADELSARKVDIAA